MVHTIYKIFSSLLERRFMGFYSPLSWDKSAQRSEHRLCDWHRAAPTPSARPPEQGWSSAETAVCCISREAWGVSMSKWEPVKDSAGGWRGVWDRWARWLSLAASSVIGCFGLTGGHIWFTCNTQSLSGWQRKCVSPCEAQVRSLWPSPRGHGRILLWCLS